MSIHRVGLSVMRAQPFHKGHEAIINTMISECETVVVCLGSAQKSREKHDPWTIEERIDMIQRVYGAYNNKGEFLGSRVKIIPLTDIGAATPQKWVSYIVEKIEKLGLPEPTDYFTGSEFDAAWFRDHFAADWRALEGHYYNQSKEKVNGQPSVEGNSYERYVGENGIFRRLHNIQRQENRIPSATELRGFMELRLNDWKEWIATVNHETLDETYPDEFKVPMDNE